MGLKMVAEERYARPDTSVAGQALKLVAAKPDAILVGASGTGAALPQIALRERGFTGLIYQTHGAVTKDFIRIAGKSAEGVILPSGPLVVAELLPDSPQKAVAIEHLKLYEGKHGARHAHAVRRACLGRAAAPEAHGAGRTEEGQARHQGVPRRLRDALETEKEIPASHGVYNFTPTDHFGLDKRGRVLLTVKDGNWAIVK